MVYLLRFVENRTNAELRFPLFHHIREGNYTGKTYHAFPGPQALLHLLEAVSEKDESILGHEVVIKELRALFFLWQKTLIGGGVTVHPRGTNYKKGVGSKGWENYFESIVPGEKSLNQVILYGHHLKKCMLEILRKDKFYHFMSYERGAKVTKGAALKFIKVVQDFTDSMQRDEKKLHKHLQYHMEMSCAFKGSENGNDIQHIGEWVSFLGDSVNFGKTRTIDFLGTLPASEMFIFARQALDQVEDSIASSSAPHLTHREKAGLVFALSHVGILPTGFAYSLLRDARLEWHPNPKLNLISWQLGREDVYQMMRSYVSASENEGVEEPYEDEVSGVPLSCFEMP